MYLTIKKRNEDGTLVKESLPIPCRYGEVTYYDDYVRIEVVMGEGTQVESKEYRLPRDGDDAYLTNDIGRTIGHYRWPPRSAEKEFRA